MLPAFTDPEPLLLWRSRARRLMLKKRRAVEEQAGCAGAVPEDLLAPASDSEQASGSRYSVGPEPGYRRAASVDATSSDKRSSFESWMQARNAR